LRRLSLTAVLFFAIAVPAAAQQVTVQQPVIRTFGVGTTVSVPDRGSALLGGVSSSAAGRSTFGPLRSGSAMGLETQGSSVSVGVYIHDLRAMDEALLAAAAKSASDNPWERKLVERRSGSTTGTVVRQEPQPKSRAGEFEALAQRAEHRGKPAVALTYWRLAAKEGSTLARTKLAEPSVVAKSTR